MAKFPFEESRTKYGNRKVTVDGIKFDSQGEASRWGELKMLERAKKISDLQRQVRLVLQPEFNDDEGKKVGAIVYVLDFTYTLEDGTLALEDFKGFQTRDSLMKEKILRYQIAYGTHGKAKFIKSGRK